MNIQKTIAWSIVISGVGFCFSPFNSNPYLTPGSTPETSIWVNWNTESQESTIVAYGISPALSDTVRLNGVRTYHHIMLDGLLAGTKYYYKILPAGDLRYFWTFPSYADSFMFIVFGDTRSDSFIHQLVINRMAHYDFKLLLHSGDLVASGDNTSDWRKFFNCEETVIGYKQFLPTIGNHESPYWPFETLFVLPNNNRYYSLNYGNTHFIILNTQEDISGDQLDWLINDLNGVSNDTMIDWIVVNFHRPPYSSGNHGSQMDIRTTWSPIFENYNVDLVFSGHDHDYERTVKINGVVYIVTGGGGAPLHPVDSSPWTAYSEMTYHFCHITVADRQLILRAINLFGIVFDSLVLNKTIGITEADRPICPAPRIWPNPFSNNVIIEWYSLNKDTKISIFDCSGRRRKVINISPEGPSRKITWDGMDENQKLIEPGVYFLIFETKKHRLIKKVVRVEK